MKHATRDPLFCSTQSPLPNPAIHRRASLTPALLFANISTTRAIHLHSANLFPDIEHLHSPPLHEIILPPHPGPSTFAREQALLNLAVGSPYGLRVTFASLVWREGASVMYTALRPLPGPILGTPLSTLHSSLVFLSNCLPSAILIACHRGSSTPQHIWPSSQVRSLCATWTNHEAKYKKCYLNT